MQYRPLAIRVDIEEELKAMERGECGLCRVMARHPDDSDCEKAQYWADYWDKRKEQADGES